MRERKKGGSVVAGADRIEDRSERTVLAQHIEGGNEHGPARARESTRGERAGVCSQKKQDDQDPKIAVSGCTAVHSFSSLTADTEYVSFIPFRFSKLYVPAAKKCSAPSHLLAKTAQTWYNIQDSRGKTRLFYGFIQPAVKYIFSTDIPRAEIRWRSIS